LPPPGAVWIFTEVSIRAPVMGAIWDVMAGHGLLLVSIRAPVMGAMRAEGVGPQSR